MKPLRTLVLLILASLVALPATASAANNASTSPSAATYRFEWTDGTVLTGAAAVKNGVSYIGMEAIVQTMIFSRVIWLNERKVKYDGFRTDFTISIGKLAADIGGKPVTLAGAPFKIGEDIYVPASFLLEALRGTKLAWDPKLRVVTATGLRKDAGARIAYGIAIDYETGTLTRGNNADGSERKLAELGMPIRGSMSYEFRRTEGGLLLLTIMDDYGEPHIHNQLFQIVLKNGGLIRQSSAYFHERGPRIDISYGNTIVLTNGKQLRLIEDGTGNVLEKIDLTKIGGENDNYFVEGIDEDFLLLRANKSGMLKLYDRRTQEVVLLYKELLNPSLFEITETYTQPMVGAGDYLTFVKREGDALLFRNEAPYVSEEQRMVIHRFELEPSNATN
ncbi:stalk domain-containing protein [Cohnella sp. GCM10027633]|uniref:stalk domain-containing protein n=1 Tax=unclassified Cohnella TaxID=2636738 RepID=UPI00363C6922